MVVNGFEIQKLIGKQTSLRLSDLPSQELGREINPFNLRQSLRSISDSLLKSIIGQGKFSYVFKSKRVEDKRMVALKLIKIFDMDNEK